MRSEASSRPLELTPLRRRRRPGQVAGNMMVDGLDHFTPTEIPPIAAPPIVEVVERVKRRWFCEPCEHRWWQHRHPDVRMRYLGFAMMLIGALEVLVGLTYLGVLRTPLW
jgi:hypothetical protein